MADVHPFRGLRYAPSLAREMDRLAAPPYDVISESERARLEQAHPKNVVRLILPGEAGKLSDGSFYSGAAELLKTWIREGTLQRDSHDSFYPYRQTFSDPEGARIARLGFLGALSLEATDSGHAALAHERTLDAPRQDRTRLIAACRANLSPIFLLHPDESGRVGECLAAATARRPEVAFTDSHGVQHELWRQDRPEPIESMQAAMRPDWTFIADGHHRYESAVSVMKSFPEAEGARRVLAFFCSLKDRGFRIFPIHRLLRVAPEPAHDKPLRALLSEHLDHEELPTSTTPEPLLERLRQSGEGSTIAVLRDPPPLLLRLPRRTDGSEASPADGLDTVRLERDVFSRLLGVGNAAVSGGAIGYASDAGAALGQVSSGDAEAAFLLNPLRMEAVLASARAGFRLPQKSTYFYPKVYTGLVIRPF